MSQKIVQRRLQIVIDESGADAALKKLTASSNRLEKAIAEGQKAGRDMTSEIERLSKNRDRIKELSDVVSGKMTPSFTQARTAVSNLKRELDRMSADNPRYAATFDKYKQASQVFTEMQTRVSGFRNTANSVFSQIKSVALGVTVGNTITAITQSITGLINSSIQGAAKLSDEIANIQKATGLSRREVEALNSSLSSLDTRTSTSALREIAVSLGQAGEAASVANVQALDMINVALGDEFGGNAQEIGNVLSVLRNNLSDIKTENFAADVTAIGNALNELGANGLATAPVVTDIANRIAGVAGTFGVSSGEILGTAAAFQELGINVERGSTAYVRLLQKMATDTEAFAKVAGVSTAEFRELVNTNINEALLLVAKNSSNAASSNADFAAMLEELGSEGVGVSELLSKLAANGDLVRDKITLATGALKENTSIMNEFELKNNTLGAEVDKLGKKLAAAFNSSEIRTATTNFIGWLNEALESGNAANNEFDRTSQEFKKLESDLNALLPRYDELSGKTNRNSTEQAELRNLINQIVELVPSAASAFDQYGNALDINKDKLNGYLSNNKQLLRELESDAVDSLTERIDYILEFIPKAQSEINTALRFGDEERAKKWISTLRKVQIEAVDNADILRDKYGIELPSEIGKGVNEIAKALGRIRELPGALDKPAQQVYDLLLPPDTKPGSESSATNKPATVTPRANPVRTGKTPVQLEAERRKKELADLAKELQNIEKEAYINSLEPYEKSLAQIAKRYDQLFEKAGNDIKSRERVLRNFLNEVEAINKQAQDAMFQDFEKQAADELKREADRKAAEDKVRDKGIEDRSKARVAKEIADTQINLINAVSDYEVQRNMETLKKKQEAQLKALAIEKQQALTAAADRGESVAVVEKQYEEKIKQQKAKDYEERVQFMADTAKKIVEGLGYVSEIMAGFERGRLNRIEGEYAEEQKRLDSLLESKLISEQDYHYRSKNLEDRFQREKQRIAQKEFRRKQILSIAEIMINAAVGSVNLWKNPGFPAAIPLQILLGLQTAAAIATTLSQKPPQFAKGGILPQGPSHAEGGIALRDNRTGSVVGEIEGGEPIISKRVYKANKRIVDALLQKGWAQDSSPLPEWYTARPSTIDISRITHARNQSAFPRFANGGFAPMASDVAGQPAAAAEMMNMQQVQLLGAILEAVNRPQRNYVVYDDVAETGKTLEAIRDGGILG